MTLYAKSIDEELDNGAFGLTGIFVSLARKIGEDTRELMEGKPLRFQYAMAAQAYIILDHSGLIEPSTAGEYVSFQNIQPKDRFHHFLYHAGFSPELAAQ